MTDPLVFSATFPPDGTVLNDLTIAVEASSSTAIFGPNGAGKTSLLRTIAGVIPGIERDSSVAYLPQQPHLFRGTVQRNLNLGSGSAASAANLCAAMGLEDVLGSDVRHLSGGQAQRVALAQALSGSQPVVLLDEPLAPIDVVDRTAVVSAIRRATEGRALITVTHSADDVALLARDLIILDDGLVLQQGPVAQVLREPATARVAAIVGVSNVYTGKVSSQTEGVAQLAVGTGELTVASSASIGTELIITVRPESVGVFVAPPHDSTYRNLLEGSISSIRKRDSLVEIGIDASLPMVALVTPGSVASLDLREGTRVWFAIKTAAIEVEETG
ncbi:MAG: ATP-binding cassette domain-containing protein [Acidimicrobiia bacterium]